MKLDHIVILLGTPEITLPFYRHLLPLLGFQPERGDVYSNADGLYLDFRTAGEPAHAYRRQAPGLNHLGFTAPDLAAVEAIQSKMRQAGFDAPEIQNFPDSSALFMKDPEGMRIEVACYH